MKIRAFLAAAVLATTLASALAACGHGPGGKLPVDTMQYNVKTKAWEPFMAYKAPDIDEITGIDSDADEPAAEAPQTK